MCANLDSRLHRFVVPFTLITTLLVGVFYFTHTKSDCTVIINEAATKNGKLLLELEAHPRENVGLWTVQRKLYNGNEASGAWVRESESTSLHHDPFGIGWFQWDERQDRTK